MNFKGCVDGLNQTGEAAQKQQAELINQVLVRLFNDLTRIEENTLHQEGAEDLSMREIHIIEAVCEAGGDNTMAALAERLRVTPGSLTVAVGTLVRKGYLTRQRSQEDKRRVHVLATDKALAVNQIHYAYHVRMTQTVMDVLKPEQLETVLIGLEAVQDYFRGQEEKTR